MVAETAGTDRTQPHPFEYQAPFFIPRCKIKFFSTSDWRCFLIVFLFAFDNVTRSDTVVCSRFFIMCRILRESVGRSAAERCFSCLILSCKMSFCFLSERKK